MEKNLIRHLTGSAYITPQPRRRLEPRKTNVDQPLSTALQPDNNYLSYYDFRPPPPIAESAPTATPQPNVAAVATPQPQANWNTLSGNQLDPAAVVAAGNPAADAEQVRRIKAGIQRKLSPSPSWPQLQAYNEKTQRQEFEEEQKAAFENEMPPWEKLGKEEQKRWIYDTALWGGKNNLLALAMPWKYGRYFYEKQRQERMRGVKAYTDLAERYERDGYFDEANDARYQAAAIRAGLKGGSLRNTSTGGMTNKDRVAMLGQIAQRVSEVRREVIDRQKEKLKEYDAKFTPGQTPEQKAVGREALVRSFEIELANVTRAVTDHTTGQYAAAYEGLPLFGVTGLSPYYDTYGQSRGKRRGGGRTYNPNPRLHGDPVRPGRGRTRGSAEAAPSPVENDPTAWADAGYLPPAATTPPPPAEGQSKTGNEQGEVGTALRNMKTMPLKIDRPVPSIADRALENMSDGQYKAAPIRTTEVSFDGIPLLVLEQDYLKNGANGRGVWVTMPDGTLNVDGSALAEWIVNKYGLTYEEAGQYVSYPDVAELIESFENYMNSRYRKEDAQ